MAKTSTRTNLAADPPRSVPETGSGDVRVDPLAIPVVSSDERIAAHTSGFYAALRAAVACWGGTAALAAQTETAMSVVSERLNRREVKGAMQRAFLDYAAIVTTDAGAAEAFLFGICDVLGFERPRRRRVKTTDEKLAALVRTLRGAGELGEAAIRRAARELGADVSEYLP